MLTPTSVRCARSHIEAMTSLEAEREVMVELSMERCFRNDTLAELVPD